MIPGMNPRKMAQMMKRMGIQQQDISATVVTIETADSKIVLRSPQVTKVNMMGQMTYQIIGKEEVLPLETKEVEINEDDVKTVMDQTNVSKEVALTAIKEHDGDLAGAILALHREADESDESNSEE